MHKVLVVVFPLALLAASCGPGKGHDTAPGGNTASQGSEAWPSEDEVRTYLDGKSLPLKVEGGAPAADGPSVTIRGGNIKALEVTQGGVQGNGGPWSTRVTFLYDDQGTKYAVEANVQHRKVKDQRAFFGFDVTRVAKQ
jgi:hypothetical protein